MKIYIAGKITGDKNYREKFNAVEKLLASQGYSVMNPARLGNYSGFSWEEYMGVSTSMQRICDAAVFLPDWHESRGAKLEMKTADESRGAKLEMKTAESLGQKIFLWFSVDDGFILAPYKQGKKK